MPSPTEKDVLTALAQVPDPATGKDVVTSGMVSGVVVRGGKVGFILTIKPEEKDNKVPLRVACERAVQALPGVDEVTAVLTAESSSPPPPASDAPARRAVWNSAPIENVNSIIAVASGKGGVGKSTVAVLLALSLAAEGKRVGLLDADIYGPSIPRMMGLSGKPEIKDGKMLPPEKNGVQCISMGFLTDEAAILRGPMISKALTQLLRGVAWGAQGKPLDALIIDMPPGTGDIHLSLVQAAPITGAIIVTTPQEVAVMDARKCLQMFQKVGVKLLGVVENMSAFTDTASGNISHPFGVGGGEKLAKEFSIPLLASLPLDPEIGKACDEGKALNLLEINNNFAIIFSFIDNY